MILIDHDEKGEILSVIDYPTNESWIVDFYPSHLFLPPGVLVYPLTQYVVNGELHPRPKQSGRIVDGRLDGLMEGAQVFIGAKKVSIDENVPSGVVVTVKIWPYCDLQLSN